MRGGKRGAAAALGNGGGRSSFAATPVDCHRMRIQRAHIRYLPSHGHRAVLVDRCRIHADRIDHGGYVGDRHGRMRCGVPPIVIVDGGDDRVAVGHVVVQILMGLVEACRTGKIVEELGRRPITPVHLQRERIQRSGIGNRPSQRAHTILARRRGRQTRENRSHIADRHRCAGRAAIAIVVGDRDADGVAVRCVVIQVLMRVIERRRSRWIVERFNRRAIAPIDRRREGV